MVKRKAKPWDKNIPCVVPLSPKTLADPARYGKDVNSMLQKWLDEAAKQIAGASN